MGIFDIFSKKKQEPSLPLPPSELAKGRFMSELPDIRGSEIEEIPAAEEMPVYAQPGEAREGVKAAFVSVQDYKAMVDGAEYIITKLSQAEAMIASMQELKKHGDKEIELWKTKLDDVQKKLAFVEEVLGQGG